MGMRRLRALIHHLPRDSALARDIAPESAAWTNTDELLAGLIEVTDAWFRVIVKGLGAKGLGPPVTIDRPTDAPHAPPTRGTKTWRDVFLGIQALDGARR